VCVCAPCSAGPAGGGWGPAGGGGHHLLRPAHCQRGRRPWRRKRRRQRRRRRRRRRRRVGPGQPAHGGAESPAGGVRLWAVAGVRRQHARAGGAGAELCGERPGGAGGRGGGARRCRRRRCAKRHRGGHCRCRGHHVGPTAGDAAGQLAAAGTHAPAACDPLCSFSRAGSVAVEVSRNPPPPLSLFQRTCGCGSCAGVPVCAWVCR
jgi:hypothetical protein